MKIRVRFRSSELGSESEPEALNQNQNRKLKNETLKGWRGGPLGGGVSDYLDWAIALEWLPKFLIELSAHNCMGNLSPWVGFKLEKYTVRIKICVITTELELES